MRLRRLALTALLPAAAVALPAVCFAHVERSSYWPNPAPDASVSPPAGGKVPKPRSLSSALRRSAPGHTRVVCKNDSLRRADRSIRRARRRGYRFRPTEPLRTLSRRRAAGLRRINARLFERCRYRNIQRAVLRSGNDDRVVVMPGAYTEQPSRREPKNDPRCARYREPSENGQGAASYRYQASCPNDQSLIYVQGRALTDKPVPYPPLKDRHGIPDAGPCVRCNLQLEGSGVVPEDVVIDGAKDRRMTKLRKQGEATKDVVIRADRTDGLVIRNITVAHALEHGIYLHETDGYLLDRIHVLYNGEYGALMFTSDHGLTRDCEGAGNGDSAVYPGGAPDTGEQTVESAPRLNQTITRCDIHHNTLGYSGTMGNATHVIGNNFYDNGTGITTDSFYAGGHPGYPQDSAVYERNNIYSNNFNSFTKDSDVEPRVPVPVGVGILIAGGNNDTVRLNRIWDNWRRGTMLIAVPDVLSGETGVRSTSNRNRYYQNLMGIAPGGTRKPNGVDFWWDGYPTNTDNCWYQNGNVTSDPPGALLPSNCHNTSSGVFYPTHSAELGGCAGAIGGGSGYDPNICPWFRSPPRPGSSASARYRGSSGSPAVSFADVVRRSCRLLGSSLACDPFRGARP